jgi:hypothetical protein
MKRYAALRMSRRCFAPYNDIEFSGEEEGAQRLTMSPLQ